MDFEIGRRLWRFHGGTPLRHWKRMSIGEPLEFAGIPPLLVLPLRQHVGAAAKPIVKRLTHVRKGQLLATSTDDHAGALLHAPTSGIIRAIEDRPVPHPSNLEGPCIVIEPDGDDEPMASHPSPDWKAVSPGRMWARIRDAGIVGLGGAVFPTHTKLKAGASEGIDVLIINGAECEPYISCDEMLMRHETTRLIRGTQILARILQPQQTVIAIEDQMGAVEKILESAIQDLDATGVSVVKVPTIYPEGGERQLIQVLTGQEVPAGGFPLDLGIVVQNVGTAAAAYDAVVHDRPLTSRIVSVTGRGVAEPRNLEVLIGTPVAHLIERAGGYTDRASRLVMGGPMMGFALETDAVPISKATNCVLALTEGDTRPTAPEMPCIRCGECSRVCPAQLLPQELFWYIRAGDFPRVRDYDLFDCIECGCCAYVCPSHIPLVDYYRHAKSEIRFQDEQQQRAELARVRFEARNIRLERDRQERRDRLQKKRAALKADGKSAEIAAAIERSKARRADKNGSAGPQVAPGEEEGGKA